MAAAPLCLQAGQPCLCTGVLPGLHRGGWGGGKQGGSSTWLVPELPRGSEALCPHCSSGSSDPTSAQDLTWPPSNWRQVSQVPCHLLLPCGEAV